MRPEDVEYLVVHSSATPPTMDIGRQEIDQWHRQRGWWGIGYHFVIRRDGTIESGRPESKAGAHTYGYNSKSIGICMVGGLSEVGKKAEKNFTEKQWDALETLIESLVISYPTAEVVGHRDLGRTKCPSFDVREWYATTFGAYRK